MNAAEQVEGIRKRLKEVMGREIHIMRELLSNLHMEQESHLSNNPERLRTVLRQRECITGALGDSREERIQLIYELAAIAGKSVDEDGRIDQAKSLAVVMEYAGDESCEIMLLRDQMLALLEQLNTLSARNNYLIQHKLDNTKNLLHALQPSDPNTIYGVSGSKKVKTAVLPIVNQEV